MHFGSNPISLVGAFAAVPLSIALVADDTRLKSTFVAPGTLTKMEAAPVVTLFDWVIPLALPMPFLPVVVGILMLLVRTAPVREVASEYMISSLYWA
jgi:hypothetical protein